MKIAAIRLLLEILRLYYRRAPIIKGKYFIWRRLIEPYISWRALKTTTRTAFGSLMEVDLRDSIQRFVYFFGVFEPEITRYVSERLRPGDIFIDIGANVGYYALLAAKLVGSTGKVFAIEASPSIFLTLEQNLRLNAATNVSAINVAITDKARSVTVYLHDRENLGGTTIMPMVAERRRTTAEMAVRGLPLPSVLEHDIIRNARLIKVDVEGAEWQVFLGLGKLLLELSDRTEIIVEVDPQSLSEQGVETTEFLDLLNSAGFAPFTIENRYSYDFYIGRKPVEPLPLERAKRGQSEPTLSAMTDLVFRPRASVGGVKPC